MELVPPTAKRIIVAPLNWGLGHATRSVPIIRKLLSQDKEVILASDGEALELLRAEFPQLATVSLPSYKVRYDNTSLLMIVLRNSLNISTAIHREKAKCKQLLKELKPDMIISDSRFGFRNRSVRSVIITHQLNPQSSNPIMRWFLEKGNRYFLNKFDECWVPDDVEHKLSGILSQNLKIKKVRYLGPLSRLDKTFRVESEVYDLAIVLSGPEPARSKLEAKLIDILGDAPSKICLVRGTKAAPSITLPDSWTTYHLADSQQINEILLQSKAIVSRSGYTSIMDYAHLDIGAYLIPTPGQTEQEYLAEHLGGREGFVWLRDLRELKNIT